uniref:NADH-ubiquinone oxidoreductase chain 5 n=1 Tax=Eurytoma sp. TJS-2016 TaxID=1855182 RepID=A0A1X9HY92_9HYME|nr:NADH dehydrogenase subunit 5 [Eurytoma sp. TJS-2016]
MLLYYLSSMIFLLISIFMFFLSLIFMILKKSIFFEWNVLNFNSILVNMFIYLDWMGLMFVFVVLIISSMILLYSSEYMFHDLTVNRFFFLLFFFIISMLLMVMSPNLISILIGWDGLGLVSYCLVIYYQSYSSFNSGMLTILMNRIGDVFILMSIGFMMLWGSWNFMNLNNFHYMILILVILASFTKSAQFPFSSWLPAAMAAPTPVSSLVHSSTLVTAGVYLLIRFHYLIFKYESLMFYIIISGVITMVFAGMSANFEFDFKKIIAYSTLSQLGLMMMIIGFKNFELSYFHLIIHAMFKSLMFMCSGMVIHSMANYQDIRFMGLLMNYLPLTMMIFLISNLSLCGMPFFSGFYSKDQILEFMLMNNSSLLIYFLMILGTGLTVSYSFRLSYYLMKNFNFFPLSLIQDNKIMNFSMMILLTLTLMFGYLMNWILFMMIEEVYLLMFEKILILFICLMFFLKGNYIYKSKFKWNFNYFMKYFFGNMWMLYKLNNILIKNFLIMGKLINLFFDKGYMEWIFKKSMLNFSKDLNLNFLKLNLNYLMNLLLMMSYMLLLLVLFL